MRIPINLASEPFRRDRPMLVASGACAVVLAGLLGLLIFLIAAERARRAIRGVGPPLSQELSAATPPSKPRWKRRCGSPPTPHSGSSLLLNTLLERKSISWTSIFADLEAVMPYNVRLIQVRLPQINSRNQVRST